MPEHVHLIIDPRTAANTAPRVLFDIKKPFAEQALARWRELNAKVLSKLTDAKGKAHFWMHSGGFDRNVRKGTLGQKVHYVHQNPVERGLSASAEEWAWSSASFYKTGEQGIVKVVRATPE